MKGEHISESRRYSSRLVEVSESRPDGLWMGGYRIDYDQHGNEIGRTDVTWNLRLYVLPAECRHLNA